MSLDFELLVPGEGIHDDLDGAWLVRLIHTCKEGASVIEHFDLVQIHALFKLDELIPILDLSDRFVLARGEHRWGILFAFALEDTQASKIDIGHSEGPDGIGLIFLGL